MNLEKFKISLRIQYGAVYDLHIIYLCIYLSREGGRERGSGNELQVIFFHLANTCWVPVLCRIILATIRCITHSQDCFHQLKESSQLK